MNSLLRDILFMVVVIIFSNLIVDIGGEQKTYLTNPLWFFGSAIILGIIGGLGMNGLNRYFNRRQRKDQDG